MSFFTVGCALLAGAACAAIASVRIKKADAAPAESLRLAAHILLFVPGGLILISGFWHLMLGGSLGDFVSADPFYRRPNSGIHLAYAALAAGVVFWIFHLVERLKRSRGAA